MSYVFLHGLGQNAQAWDKVQSHFPGAICPDLTQCPDYPSLYQTLSAQLQCVPNPLYLCGLSLGGVLALDFTLKNPDRVRSLVLIGAQYKMPKTLLSLQNAVLRLMGRREMVRMCNSMKHLDFSAELGRISCPVLVVCGEKDKANRKAAQELNYRLIHGKLEVVERAGHEVNVDAPEALAKILRRFWG